MKTAFLPLFLFLSFSLSNHVKAQATVEHQGQSWAAYMTTTRITDKFSVFTDFHLVPEGFGVARTGLSWHMIDGKIVATAGYGHLWLPNGLPTKELTRDEHRPWGQVVFNNKMTEKLTYTTRVRYDARFREKVVAGKAVGGYNFNHRVRFMMNFRYALPIFKTSIGTPFIATANEVLINFGREVVYNSLDQNRLSFLTGIQGKGWSFQVGYMNRYVQLASGNKYVANHTLLLWLTQTFDFRKKPTTKSNGVKHI